MNSAAAQARPSLPVTEPVQNKGSCLRVNMINLGGAYPNQKLTIMINGKDRSKFPVVPEDAFKDKNICVTGKVIQYKGKPEIVVDDPSQITIDN